MNATLNQAKHLIWRNLPSGETTMGPCERACGQPARGSGICLACAQSDLAKLVGAELAAEYVEVIRNLRTIEERMLKTL